MLGDTVNLASRLESQSKLYGVKTILGASTAAATAGRFAILEIDLIRVKGKAEAERISTLIGGPEILVSNVFSALKQEHEAMLAVYRSRDWQTARRHLAACGELCNGVAGPGLAGLYELYATRLAAFEREPPPADWTGVYVAVSK